MKEEWKNIEGYEGKYQVSNTGKVRSFCNNKWGISNQPKPKKIHTRRRGYVVVNLLNSETKYVHRLVAKAFIPNPKNKPCINHKDGNPSNNNAENLEWCTYSENHIHAYKNGLMKVTEETKRKISKANSGKATVWGESHGKTVLQKEDVIQIRKRSKSGEYNRSIAKDYPVTESTISNIVNRKTWQHL